MLPIYKTKKRKTTTTTKKTDLVKKLDKVFSLYIRIRDTMPNGFCRCISCGQIKPFKSIDAGHYYSRSHMATRFHPDNVHGECTYCNRYRSDHLIQYRKNLIIKIGAGRVDRLEALSSSTKHWLDCELEQVIAFYKEETKKMCAVKGIKLR